MAVQCTDQHELDQLPLNHKPNFLCMRTASLSIFGAEMYVCTCTSTGQMYSLVAGVHILAHIQRDALHEQGRDLVQQQNTCARLIKI